MFEFRYSVQLVFIRPSIDPKIITDALGMQPDIQSRAGTETFDVHGKSRGRNASLSVWNRRLHEQPTLNSEQVPLESLIAQWTERLHAHEALVHRVNDEGGEVKFRIGWYAEGSYTTEVLDSHALEFCGRVGLGLEINVIKAVEGGNKESGNG